MFNFRIHENGWTVIIEDFDLKLATQEDINKIAKFIATSTCVVIRNQSLSIDEELRILQMFRNHDRFLELVNGDKNDENYKALAADVTKDPTGILLRITAELRDGLQGGGNWAGEFVWHCNQAENPKRKPIVWLHGVRGTEGSRTSFTNTIPAYESLDSDLKLKIQNLHSIYGTFQAPEGTRWHDDVRYNMEWTPPLVHRNIANKTGMFFSPRQILKFVELTKEESDTLKNLLFDHVLQQQYVYDHDWRDGDIVISEQWLGVHKRWAFDHMDRRVLHRAAFDFPEQDYTT